MKEFTNIRENRLGGFDADTEINGEVVPYTLTQEDIDGADLSGAAMLPQAAKDAYTAAQDLATEQAWVKSEIENADISLSIVQDGDRRSIGTVGDWRNYRKALRDRVQDGAIIGERPVRPV
jgi:hypothetical protein